jgi:hypothetical protein
MRCSEAKHEHMARIGSTVSARAPSHQTPPRRQSATEDNSKNCVTNHLPVNRLHLCVEMAAGRTRTRRAHLS